MIHRIVRNTGILALVVALLLTVKASYARPASVMSQLEKLTDVQFLLEQNYVSDIDNEKLVNAAINGMLEELDDPYTTYLTADQLDQFTESVQGTFVGIGAEVDIHNERLRIVSPLEDSPAWQAGVQPGDIVLEIEGEDTLGIDIIEAVKKLKGEKGTAVNIKVRHRSGDEAGIRITRDEIKVRSVRGIRRLSDNHFDFMLDDQNKIGYIRITQFGQRTSEELVEALTELKAQGMQALIVDVRFNPGGLLDQAVEISDLFLPKGSTVVSFKGRKVEEKFFKASSDALIGDLPLVLLANGNSASASEILAGAIKDNDRGLVVGTRTFGKGSVQQLRPLGRDQGALKLTTAYYYIPSGEKIHRIEGAERWGVDPSPDAYVPMHPEAIMELLERRRDEPSTKPYEGVEVTPEFLNETIGDPQLAAALEAALGKVRTGHWPKVGKSNVNDLVKTQQRQSLERRLELLEETRLEIERKLADLELESAAGTQPATGPATLPSTAPATQP